MDVHPVDCAVGTATRPQRELMCLQGVWHCPPCAVRWVELPHSAEAAVRQAPHAPSAPPHRSAAVQAPRRPQGGAHPAAEPAADEHDLVDAHILVLPLGLGRAIADRLVDPLEHKLLVAIALRVRAHTGEGGSGSGEDRRGHVSGLRRGEGRKAARGWQRGRGHARRTHAQRAAAAAAATAGTYICAGPGPPRCPAFGHVDV